MSKKENIIHIYILVYIRVDANNISVLAAGLKDSCCACHKKSK